LIKKDGKTYKIPPNKIIAKDSTGAGDIYSSGILYGIVNDLAIDESGKIASLISSKVVEKIGARLDKIDFSEIK